VQYLCDFLYQGCSIKFARALGLDGQHFRESMRWTARFTPAMLAQVILRTNVRAEWLLCGVGPVFAENPADGTIALPPVIQSAFSVLDAGKLPALPAPIAVVPSTCEPGVISAAHMAAAKRIVAARGADKPVCVFVGADALLGGAQAPVRELFTRRYATALAMPAAVALLEIPPSVTCDHNHIARLGAMAGFGYGESLLRWGEFAENSLPALIQTLGVPFTVHPAFGELPQHYSASVHGAELGACLGAVAYVDLLIFAEHVRKFFGAPGGVFVALGPATRAADLFLNALQSVRTLPADTLYSDVTFILANDVPDAHIEHRAQTAGCQFHFLQGDQVQTASALLQACDAIFKGASIA
jgi:hypothetical protein